MIDSERTTFYNSYTKELVATLFQRSRFEYKLHQKVVLAAEKVEMHLPIRHQANSHATYPPNATR